MTRSLWKGPYVDPILWKEIKKATQITTNTSNLREEDDRKSTLRLISPKVNMLNDTNQTSLHSKEKLSLKTINDGSRFKDISNISLRTKSEIAPKGVIKLWNKRSMILPELMGKNCQIFTGLKWIRINIKEEHVGHLLGEFIWTKKVAQYKRKSKLKK